MTTDASTSYFNHPARVRKWLENTPFKCCDVRRINVGTTNYAYRIFLTTPLEKGQHRTAVLKYSAPFTAGEPRVAFSPKRQIFEARALAVIPWRDFTYTDIYSTEVARACTCVKLPELYRSDPDNCVSIIEDCTPKVGGEIWDQSTHSFRMFLENQPESDRKHKLSAVMGGMLGTFLAQLHRWGEQPENRGLTMGAFAGNTYAKDLTIQELFTDFFTNVESIGYRVSDEQRSQLVDRIRDIEKRIRSEQQSVAMGDFWMGNVLLNFDEQNDMRDISVIDWEFVAMGPTWQDVGNFLGELFLLSYFEGTDTAYITVFDAFVRAYRKFGLAINVHQALGFAGAHMIMSLPRRIHSDRSRATQEEAVVCVDKILKFIIDPDFMYYERRKIDGLETMAEIMRERVLETNS